MRKGIGLLFATLVVGLAGAGTALDGFSPVGAAEAAHRVAIVDVSPDAMEWHYEPPDITVPVGSTVVWRNEGEQPHTVTARDDSFDSGYLTSGDTWEWTFSAPGEFIYYCQPHPWMEAVVRVGSSAEQAPAPKPAPKPAPNPAPNPAPPEPPSQPAPAPNNPPSNPTPAPPAATPRPQTAAAPAPASPPAAAPRGSTTTTTAAAVSDPPATPEAAAETTEDEASAAPSSDAADTSHEAAAARTAGEESGPEDYNNVAIGFAIAATLAVTGIGMKLLLSKP